MNEAQEIARAEAEAFAAQAQKDQEVQEQPIETPQPVEVAPAPVAETKKADESFREMREKLEYERRLRQAYEERLRQQEQLLAQQQHPEEDYDISIGDDDIAEGKVIKKLSQKQQKEREADRKKYEEQISNMKTMITEQRLLMEYPDFRQVMTTDNLQKLGQLKPHLAKSILANPDTYEAHKTAFEAIKDYVLKQEDKEAELKAQQEKIAANKTRAVPTTSGVSNPSASPLSKAHAYATGLTDQRKRELYEEWAKENGGKYYNYK